MCDNGLRQHRIRQEITVHSQPVMVDAECGCPYHGAKEAYILDFADTRKVLKVIETLWNDLPFPKSKKKLL